MHFFVIIKNYKMEYLIINSLYNENNEYINEKRSHSRVINSEIKQLKELQHTNLDLVKKENTKNVTNTLEDKLNRLEKPIIISTQERSRFYNLNNDKMSLKGFKHK